MRIFVFAVCGVLMTASLAVAAPAERAALLERLRAALPKISEIVPFAETMSAEMRQELLRQNPGKEAVVGPVADGFGACVAKMFAERDYVGVAVAGADKAGMTEAELLTVVTFYEDPGVKAMFSSVGPTLLTDERPELDPAQIKRLEAAAREPAMLRFTAIMQESTEGMADEEALMDDAVACAADFDEAVDEAGLVYVPPEDDEDEQ